MKSKHYTKNPKQQTSLTKSSFDYDFKEQSFFVLKTLITVNKFLELRNRTQGEKNKVI